MIISIHNVSIVVDEPMLKEYALFENLTIIENLICLEEEKKIDSIGHNNSVKK